MRAPRRRELVGELVGAGEEEAHQIGLAPLFAVLILEGLGEDVAGGIELGGLLQPADGAGGVVGLEEEIGGLGEEARLLLAALELGALPERAGRVGEAARAEVRLLGQVPDLGLAAELGGLGVGVARAAGVLRLQAQLAELLEERALDALVLDAAHGVADHLRREIPALALLVELDGGVDGGLVLGGEVGDARPGLGGGRRILALLLVEGGELLLEGDLLLDVGGAHRLLLEEHGEVVPAGALLQQAAELLLGLLVAAVDLAELLPRLDRGLDVAELRLADPGHVAELGLAGLR